MHIVASNPDLEIQGRLSGETAAKTDSWKTSRYKTETVKGVVQPDKTTQTTFRR